MKRLKRQRATAAGRRESLTPQTQRARQRERERLRCIIKAKVREQRKLAEQRTLKMGSHVSPHSYKTLRLCTSAINSEKREPKEGEKNERQKRKHSNNTRLEGFDPASIPSAPCYLVANCQWVCRARAQPGVRCGRGEAIRYPPDTLLTDSVTLVLLHDQPPSSFLFPPLSLSQSAPLFPRHTHTHTQLAFPSP